MSPKEGLFMGGVMLGMILCYKGAEALGWHPIIGILTGVVVGAGIGYVAQQAYLSMRKPPEGPGA